MSIASSASSENLGFAVLGLVAGRDGGVHGYRLKEEFEALCDDFWEVNYGRLYRVLSALESKGELESEFEVQDSRPNKKVYRITEKGRRTLDDWLLAPVSDAPRPLRDELTLKLLFLDSGRIEDIARVEHIERKVS